jgi:phosphotransferase system enzyme I (PtsI)
MSFTLHGLAVSGGIAIGQAHLISQATLEVSHLVVSRRAWWKRKWHDFETALQRVRAEFDAMKASLEKSPADMRAFIDLHRMILEDPELSEVPKQIIRERRCNAEWAIVQQMEVLVEQFEQVEDIYLRERSYDVRQAVERVVRELSEHPDHASGRIKGVKGENLIVVGHDLSPADVMAFKDQNFASFVTDVGGATSHTAILARGMGIPAVLGLHNARALIRDKETLIVDGTRGVVIVNPR